MVHHNNQRAYLHFSRTHYLSYKNMEKLTIIILGKQGAKELDIAHSQSFRHYSQRIRV